METIFWLLLAFRIGSSLILDTFFQADEYWQSLEPAHWVVFGYGGLTWEWEHGLRSALHPLLYAVPYWMVKGLGLDYGWLVALPKLLNGIIAAVGEYYLYFYVLAKFKGDQKMAQWVLTLSVFSIWNWYCWSRSFANSLELSMTIVALYWMEIKRLNSCLFLAALTCIIRPTNALIWLFYIPQYIVKNPRLLFHAIAIALAALSLDFVANLYFYGKPVFPLLSFYNFNIGSNLSSFYGVSRLDFYFDQAIPILLMNYLPFFLFGLYCTPWSDLKSLLLLYLGVFTAIQHKEFRFIYPLMPIMLIYTAHGVIFVSKRVTRNKFQSIKALCLVIFVVVSYYFSRVHEAGEYRLPAVLRENVLQETKHVSVGFLTPCHSTPFQSHMHLEPSKADIWYLTCTPPINDADISNYMDESDYFYLNPVEFLEENFPSTIETKLEPPATKWGRSWPDYVVMFQNLWEDTHMQAYLGSSYRVIENLPNAKAHWDRRREGDVLLLKILDS